MDKIKDYTKYIELMKNGSMDKLFFTDKIFGEWSTLVDFGCADGFITKLLAEIFPDKHIIGYDSDPKMIDIAYNTGSKPANASFHHNIPRHGDILLLSSVIHEVYSYKTKEEISEFWNYVYNTDFKYIIIRDMMHMSNAIPSLNLTSDKLDCIRQDIAVWCLNNHFMGEFARFEEIHGDITQIKSLVHFLLKYSYFGSPNWERELFENYMAFSIGEFMMTVPNDRYRLIYQDTYGLPYLEHKWRKDFNLNIHFRTHAKIILEKIAL